MLSGKVKRQLRRLHHKTRLAKQGPGPSAGSKVASLGSNRRLRDNCRNGALQAVADALADQARSTLRPARRTADIQGGLSLSK